MPKSPLTSRLQLLYSKSMPALKQRGSIVPALVILVAVLAVGLIAGSRVRKQAPPNVVPPSATPLAFENSNATSTLVYGRRYPSAVEIGQVNTDGTNDSAVVRLGADARDVNMLSNTEFIYIGGSTYEQGEFGRGNRIEKTTITSDGKKETQEIYKVVEREGWGIDELVVSPDKKYIAWWEIRSPSNIRDHSAYASRTWVKPLTGGEKVKITEESITQNQKTKPLFFDSQNRLYTDTVQQNPYDFYLGIKRFSVQGNDLGTVLADGSYSSWPRVSPNGRYAVFTAYDGTQPATQGNTATSVRVSSLNPNTIWLIDFATDQKQLIADSSTQAQYNSHIAWSPESDSFAYAKRTVTQYNPTQKTESAGLWRYKLAEKNAKKVKDGQDYPPDARELPLVYKGSENLLIFGPTNSSGNVGSTVSGPRFNALFRVLESASDAKTPLSSGSGFEYIALVPKVAGTKFAIEIPESLLASSNQLKLKSFELPKPPPPRIPPAPEVTPGAPVPEVTPGAPAAKSASPRAICFYTWSERGADINEACEACPLYLYPTKPTDVTVRVTNAKVFLPNTPYGNEGFNVLALPNGSLQDKNGKSLSRIEYEYLTKNVPSPTRGYVVVASNLQSMLQWYGANIGLNVAETNDFVAYWVQRLPQSPYYFISHFDKASAAEKLTLDISPKPDTLLQTIMYFKPLTAPISVQAPQFDQVPQRAGFVAVDFSGKIDQ